jgi:hypothetical protein
MIARWHPKYKPTNLMKRTTFLPPVLVLLALILSACGGAAVPLPLAPQPTPVGDERIANGGFDQGFSGWDQESDVDEHKPKEGAEFGHNGAGIRCETGSGTAGISAMVQEFTPASDFTLTLFVRANSGSNRIGLNTDGKNGQNIASRIVFVDVGLPTSAVVFSAWDMVYVLHTPLDAGVWYPLRVEVDSQQGVQRFVFNDTQRVTLFSAGKQFAPINSIIFGDRQRRTDVYIIAQTTVQVTDGLNGSFDYDDISLKARG